MPKRVGDTSNYDWKKKIPFRRIPDDRNNDDNNTIAVIAELL